MPSAWALLVVVGLALAVVLGTMLGGRAVDEGGRAPVVLLTAFEPFGKRDVNASWEAVRALEGETIGGHRVAVARLPVVYDDVSEPLARAIELHRPDVVVGFGLGRGVIHVERVARNGYAASRPPDNAGRPPPRAEVVPGGAAEIPTALPVDEILAALAREGLTAEPSDDAGGYLCNECFYRLMVLDSPAGKAIRARGFVHLPDIDAPNPAGGTYTLERLRRAVRVVTERAVQSAARPARP